MMNSDNSNSLSRMIGTLEYERLEMKKGETYGYKKDLWYLFGVRSIFYLLINPFLLN